eukprot:gene19545-biopygen35559
MRSARARHAPLYAQPTLPRESDAPVQCSAVPCAVCSAVQAALVVAAAAAALAAAPAAASAAAAAAPAPTPAPTRVAFSSAAHARGGAPPPLSPATTKGAMRGSLRLLAAAALPHRSAPTGAPTESPAALPINCPARSRRCGPLFDNAHCNCLRGRLYCNTQNGWCGSTMAHKKAQPGDEYDCSTLPSRCRPTSSPTHSSPGCSFEAPKLRGRYCGAWPDAGGDEFDWT